jgi:ABC-type bacteriocin/lantibiotic exporter with double-glycine peptidase domain
LARLAAVVSVARLAAVVSVARYHGVKLDPESVKLHEDEEAPSPPVLVAWLQESGLWARDVRLSFRQLMKINDPAPVILLLFRPGLKPGNIAAPAGWRCRC